MGIIKNKHSTNPQATMRVLFYTAAVLAAMSATSEAVKIGNTEFFEQDFAQTAVEQNKPISQQALSVAPAKSNQEKVVNAGGAVKPQDPKTATLVANQEKVTYEVRFSSDANEADQARIVNALRGKLGGSTTAAVGGVAAPGAAAGAGGCPASGNCGGAAGAGAADAAAKEAQKANEAVQEAEANMKMEKEKKDQEEKSKQEKKLDDAKKEADKKVADAKREAEEKETKAKDDADKAAAKAKQAEGDAKQA